MNQEPENQTQEQNQQPSEAPQEKPAKYIVTAEYANALEICRTTIEKHGVELNVAKLVSNTRNSEIVFTRALICMILRKQGMSMAKIGQAIGGQTHASVINLLKWDEKKQCRSEIYRDTGKTYLQLFCEIRNELKTTSLTQQ